MSRKFESIQVDPSPEKQIESDAEIDLRMARAEQRISEIKEQWEHKRELGRDPFASEGGVSVERDPDMHWTQALEKRIQTDLYMQKYLTVSRRTIDVLQVYDDPELMQGSKRAKRTQKFYYDKIRTYQGDTKRVFASTGYGPGSTFNALPKSLGIYGEGSPEGAVFSDSDLTDTGKMIIESHEKGHAMRTFPFLLDLVNCFDFDKRKDAKNRYLLNPDELIERMSQLKNYFGFKGDELFTRAHLSYAREHYLSDIDLDNQMSDFFAMITLEKEDEFLRAMNSWPI